MFLLSMTAVLIGALSGARTVHAASMELSCERVDNDNAAELLLSIDLTGSTVSSVNGLGHRRWMESARIDSSTIDWMLTELGAERRYELDRVSGRLAMMVADYLSGTKTMVQFECAKVQKF